MDGKDTGPMSVSSPSTEESTEESTGRLHLGQDLPHFELAITEAHGRRATQALSQPGDDIQVDSLLVW